MDVVRGLLMSRKGHSYLYVVDRFHKMCVLMLCKKHVIAEQTKKMLLQNVWVHFGFPSSLNLIEILMLCVESDYLVYSEESLLWIQVCNGATMTPVF